MRYFTHKKSDLNSGQKISITINIQNKWVTIYSCNPENHYKGEINNMNLKRIHEKFSWEKQIDFLLDFLYDCSLNFR